MGAVILRLLFFASYMRNPCLESGCPALCCKGVHFVRLRADERDFITSPLPVDQVVTVSPDHMRRIAGTVYLAHQQPPDERNGFLLKQGVSHEVYTSENPLSAPQRPLYDVQLTGACPHLADDACRQYRNPHRPTACATFAFGQKECHSARSK